MCGSPVRLSAADVSQAMVVMVDQSQLTTVGTSGKSKGVMVLAHELGHNLFLSHGNGLDDDGNGRPAGTTGTKRYDQYCDPAWLQAPANVELVEDRLTPYVNCVKSSSLMTRSVNSGCSQLQPLQVETARGVALVHPGAVNGTDWL